MKLLIGLAYLGSVAWSPADAQDRRASLYVRSLTECVQAKQAEVRGGITAITVVENEVLRDPNYFQPLPSKIGSVSLDFLSQRSLKLRFQRERRPIHVIEIKPIRNWRDELLIDCAEYRVSVRKGVLTFGVIGGNMIRWRFDSAVADYVKVNVEPWWPKM
jgi:hypothetical protein